jgi:transposase
LVDGLQKAYGQGSLPLGKRISALLAVAKGDSVDQVGEMLRVSRACVYNWLKEFMLKGIDSFKYSSSGGRKPKLTKTQKQRLKELIMAEPLAMGYPTGCWTSLLIQHLILAEFGVLYNRHYVCTLLHNLGFSFQKARFVSNHLDTQRRQQWMEEEWPKILKESKEKGALLLFGDEASFPWALVGQQPVVKTTGKRKGYKVFGLIDSFSGRLFYDSHEGRFNAESYQAFLEKVLTQTNQPLVIIQDGAKYHTCKAIQQFFANHHERITVYQLPSYSPDYNPIEFLWKNIKRRSTHNRYFREFDELILSVDEALAYFIDHPEEVRNLMGAYCDELSGIQKVA